MKNCSPSRLPLQAKHDLSFKSEALEVYQSNIKQNGQHIKSSSKEIYISKTGFI